MQKIIAPILGNRVLVTSLGVWTVAQVLKVIIGFIKEGKLTLSYLFTMGKMPSSPWLPGATTILTSSCRTMRSAVMISKRVVDILSLKIAPAGLA